MAGEAADRSRPTGSQNAAVPDLGSAGSQGSGHLRQRVGVGGDGTLTGQGWAEGMAGRSGPRQGYRNSLRWMWDKADRQAKGMQILGHLAERIVATAAQHVAAAIQESYCIYIVVVGRDLWPSAKGCEERAVCQYLKGR